ncbi:ATP-binding cassette domain-containing protein [Dysgonomonas sp. 216]|uniref:ABC transporter ATP-binding protein n=1 Tax=Dysgonomonas sp. 216 TaxID=2302934 RepID=UPI0013D6C169|nr:ATP-binding cassette domain-containing protein [Dysgonomonas sp. 216]NDW18290.1 ATP-binding cassette domain-containing protein [Dysgonomonas sp. 216]NDW18658.1 ATP-binding cassette domain-containing protein [Dysgonomonas sp. 216]
MATLEKISFKYKKKQVFENFDLTIDKGKVYGLLGKNGAGKSTLLYLMTGLLTSKSGKIEYDKKNVKHRLPSSLNEMFIVPEEFILPDISLKKYVKINSVFYPNFSNEQLKKNLECFDMDPDVNLQALSMGQKKKIFMSFALATNTSLLVMDEPTNGLDIPGKSQFRKFIASGMTDDKTILISTHQVKDVDNLLEQIIILDENKILMNTSATSICKKLRFVESSNNILKEDALYAAPSIQGFNLILPNNNDEETPLNLELLFNAMLENPNKLTDYLK